MFEILPGLFGMPRSGILSERLKENSREKGRHNEILLTCEICFAYYNVAVTQLGAGVLYCGYEDEENL